jgi:hypothetical protein
MSIGPWNWKPREVERAIKVARKAGLTVTGITISTAGDITIATCPPTASGSNDQSANPWDSHAANEKRPA